MPLYDLLCTVGHEEERHIPLADFDKPIICECGSFMTRLIRPLRVMSDLEPYQAVGVDIATGKAPMITSRSQHREYLKRNGYIEVGTEPLAPRAEQPVNTHEIGKQIKQTIDTMGVKL